MEYETRTFATIELNEITMPIIETHEICTSFVIVVMRSCCSFVVMSAQFKDLDFSSIKHEEKLNSVSYNKCNEIKYALSSLIFLSLTR